MVPNVLTTGVLARRGVRNIGDMTCADGVLVVKMAGTLLRFSTGARATGAMDVGGSALCAVLWFGTNAGVGAPCLDIDLRFRCVRRGRRAAVLAVSAIPGTWNGATHP